MAKYRYLLVNTTSGAVMEELPLTDVVYSWGLNGAGSIKANISLADPKCNEINMQTLTREIVIMRDSAPMAMGPIITLDAALSRQSMEIICGSVWWWTKSMTTEIDLTGTNAATVLWNALSIAQGKVPNGDKRITQGTPFTTVTYSGTYAYPGAERRYISSIAEELSGQYPGFDFMINLRSSSGGSAINIIREFQVYYPFKGTTVDQPLNPRNGLTELTMTEDGTSVITRVHEMGTVVNGTQRLSTRNSDVIANYPMIESTISRSDVDTIAELDLWAQGDLLLHHPPVRVYGASFKPNNAIPFSAINPGDTVIIDATLGQFRFNTAKRVVEITVTVGSSGDEDVALRFNDLVGA